MYGVLLVLSNALFFFSIFWSSFIGFWLCLELAMLLLIPCFFYEFNNNNVYLSLLNYLIIASISSFFLVSGLLNNLNEVFILIAFIIKVGLFPFYSWFIYLINNLNWLMVFNIAVVSKITFFYFLNYQFNSTSYFNFVAILNFFILLFFIICLVFDFKSFYAISSISSSLVLLFFLFNNASFNLYVLYFIYIIVGTLVLFSFYWIENNGLNIFSICLVIGVPFSFYIFYKGISIIFLVPFNNYIFIFFWVCYSILEQIVLFNMLLENAYLKISV
uniref:NADH dehydrogenase subunit 2 n=1 Tax=Thaparocleidus asoti TaxID=341077 RepID=A0A7L8ZR96_9PLAT|nr:NADH dehydrogenase subunit 2 [Thaparocleidus asoti]QOI72777.1 NADH dehydrogenase subunit 2 [Thaparocleidus asoti]